MPFAPFFLHPSFCNLQATLFTASAARRSCKATPSLACGWEYNSSTTIPTQEQNKSEQRQLANSVTRPRNPSLFIADRVVTRVHGTDDGSSNGHGRSSGSEHCPTHPAPETNSSLGQHPHVFSQTIEIFPTSVRGLPGYRRAISIVKPLIMRNGQTCATCLCEFTSSARTKAEPGHP